MEISKIIRVVQILTWIAFIVLAFLSVYYKYDDCNVCKLEVDGKKLDGSEFMQYYQSKCLSVKNNLDYVSNIPQINFSLK